MIVFAVSACGAQKDISSQDPKDAKSSSDTQDAPQTKGSISETLLKTMAPAIDKWQESTKTPDPTAQEMEGFKSKHEYFMKKHSGAIMEYMKTSMKKAPTAN